VGRPEFAVELATTLNNQAIMLAGENRLEDARRGYEGASEIQERLVRENPGVVEYLERLARTQNNLGALLSRLGNLRGSVLAFRRALEIEDRLARDHADVPAYTLGIARAYNNLAVVERRMRDWSQAIEDLHRARVTEEKLLGANPEIAECGELMVTTMVNLGHTLRELERRPDALTAYQSAVDRQEQIIRDNGSSPARLYDLARVMAAASLCTPDGEPYAERAVGVLRQAIVEGFRDSAKLLNDREIEPLRRCAEYQELLWGLADSPPRGKH
jgi:tetratricopeptide (TPR) repeat protein